MLLQEIILFSFFDQKRLAVDLRLVHPLDAWINQLIWVDINEIGLEIELSPAFLKFFLLLLPSRVEWWLLYILLWLIVVLELNFLKMGNFCISFTFLTTNVLFFNVFSVLSKVCLSFDRWHIFRDWVLWVCVRDTVVVICIHHDSTLSEDPVLALSTTSFHIPHKFVFIALNY